MHTNAYLGLISLQIAAGTIQKNRLDKLQGERDAETQRIAQAASDAAQNAHYAQWRQTPDGRAFETWRDQAIATTGTARSRNAAWETVRNATHARALEHATENADHSAEKANTRHLIAPLAVVALLFMGAMAGAATGSDVGLGVGAVLLLLAVIAAIPAAIFGYLIHNARNATSARIQAQAGHATQQAYGGANGASWHPHMSPERINDVAARIEHTITHAAAQYPVASALLPLTPLLATKHPSAFPSALPSDAKRLLAIFHDEDAQQRQPVAA